MTDNPAGRAAIGKIDVSGLPGPDPHPDPDWSTVRKVSESWADSKDGRDPREKPKGPHNP
jgi:hypothetical protein